MSVNGRPETQRTVSPWRRSSNKSEQPLQAKMQRDPPPRPMPAAAVLLMLLESPDHTGDTDVVAVQAAKMRVGERTRFG